MSKRKIPSGSIALSQYRDQHFRGNRTEQEKLLLTSSTLYVGNLSFYTSESQIYELFSRAGDVKRIVMGLDKVQKTPCGFCFVDRPDAENAMRYINGTRLDDRIIRTDWDAGFKEGRQFGRGKTGGQVRDEYRTDYDEARGGYGKLVATKIRPYKKIQKVKGHKLLLEALKKLDLLSKMDVLLKAVKKTPTSTVNQEGFKHSKIPEGWGENKETVAEGITFYLKYFGSTLVEDISSDETYATCVTNKAIQCISAMAKSSGKKLKKVSLTVTPKGVRILDLMTNQVMFDISIFRIRSITTSAICGPVFAYIVRNTVNETMECQAFLCDKIKIAEAVILTLSQAFAIAEERWKEHNANKIARKEKSRKEKLKIKDNIKIEPQENVHNEPLVNFDISSTQTPVLEINIDSSNLKMPCTVTQKHWQSFDEPEDDDIDEMFSKLAENRSKNFSSNDSHEKIDENTPLSFEGLAMKLSLDDPFSS